MQDYHVHSEFSYDSTSKIQDILEYSIKRKIKYLAITDHIEYQDGKLVKDFNIEEYVYTLKKYNITVGVELGWDGLGEIELKDGFDFITLAVHKMEKPCVPETCYKDYLKRVLKVIKKFPRFHVLAHLDFPRRYVGEPFLNYCEKEVEEILSFLIKHEKVLEVNCDPVKKQGEPNPSFDILKMYFDMGGKLVVLGSDAHHAEEIGENIWKTIDRLKYFGKVEIVIFDRETFHTIDIKKV